VRVSAVGTPVHHETFQGIAKRLVKVAQVIRQCEDKPKLLSGLQMKISQDVKAQVQLLVQSAGVPFEFRSEHDDLRSQCSDFSIDLL